MDYVDAETLVHKNGFVTIKSVNTSIEARITKKKMKL